MGFTTRIFSFLNLRKQCSFFFFYFSFNSPRSFPYTSYYITTNSWQFSQESFDNRSFRIRERWEACSVARQKLRVKTVRVVNIEHDSREDGKSGERFILSGGRAKISVKREIGRGGRKKKRSRGWWFRILSVVVACSPCGGWVMCTVHTINLICRVEKLSELNPATMGRWRKRAVNSIRCRHTWTKRTLPACPRSFVVSTRPRLVRGVGHFRSLRPFNSSMNEVSIKYRWIWIILVVGEIDDRRTNIELFGRCLYGRTRSYLEEFDKFDVGSKCMVSNDDGTGGRVFR